MKLSLYFLVIVIGLCCINNLYSNPVLTLQSGHISSVNSIEYSSNGKLIITASSDKNIKLWNAESGLLLRTFKGHDKEVSSAHFSISSDTIISSSTDKMLKLWRTNSGELINTFTGHQFQVSEAFIHPYNRILLSAGLDNEIRIWDITNNNSSIQRLVCKKPITSMALSNDGKMYSTGEEKILKIWKIESDKKEAGKTVFTFKANITNIEFSHDDQYLIARSSDNEIKVFSLGDDKEIFTNLCVSENFAVNKNYITFQTEDLSISIFDFKSGKKIKSSEKFDNDLVDFSFSPYGDHLAYSSINGDAGIIYIPSMRIIKHLSGTVNPIQSLDVSNINNQIATTNSDGRCNIWSLAEKMKPAIIQSGLTNILSVAFNPSGNLLSMTGMSLDNKPLEIYDIGKDESFNLKAEENAIIKGNFLSDTNYFSCLSNNNLTIFNLKTRTHYHSFRSNSTNLSQCTNPVFSNIAVSDFSGNITFFDWFNKEIKFKIQIDKSKASSIIFNSSGDKLYAGTSNGKIQIIDCIQKIVMNSIDIAADGIEITSMVFEGNKILITGSTDNSIRFIDISGTESKLIFEIKDAHENTITGLSVLNRERKLISSSTDGSFKIWDLQTLKLIASIYQTDSQNWAAISADGSFDGTQGAFSQLQWVEKNKVLPIESYFEKYYEPNLLSNFFNENVALPLTQPNQALAGLSDPPTCKILFPFDSDTLESENTKFTYEIIPATSDIEEVLIYNNGKLVKRDYFSEGKTSKITKTIFIQLVEGKNVFKIVALDKNRIESLPAEIIVNCSKSEIPSKVYVVAIGIGDYELNVLHLPFAKNDAVEFINLLSNIYMLEDDKLKTYSFFDNEAKIDNIYSALNDIANVAKPDDTFILYFAGHGITITNPETDIPEYFLILQNSNLDFYSTKFRKLNLSATYISNSIEKIKALNQLIIIDACQSGEAISKINQQLYPTNDKSLSLVSRRSGLNILSSTSSGKPAYELLDLKHGLFTYVFLQGLKGPAAYGDATVTVLGMAMYLDNELPKLSKQKLGKKQNPDKTLNGRNFVIGKVKN